MNTFTVCLVSLVFLSGRVTPFPNYDGDVLFDPLEIKAFSMPESCKSKDNAFCFEKDDYPTEIVDQLLKDMTHLEVSNEKDGGYSFSNRQGSASDAQECSAQSTMNPIYYIVDEEGNDRVVVQMEGRFLQTYTIRWCDEEGHVTNGKQFMNFTVQDYKMYCENKYLNYDFLVLSMKPDINGNWTMERARTKKGIPVCCACKYKKISK